MPSCSFVQDVRLRRAISMLDAKQPMKFREFRSDCKVGNRNFPINNDWLKNCLTKGTIWEETRRKLSKMPKVKKDEKSKSVGRQRECWRQRKTMKKRKTDLQHLHLQSSKAGTPWHWHLGQSHEYHEFVRKRYLRADSFGSVQADFIQQKVDSQFPRDSDCSPVDFAWRIGEARGKRRNQGCNKVHIEQQIKARWTLFI